jgi:hypothetical protein
MHSALVVVKAYYELTAILNAEPTTDQKKISPKQVKRRISGGESNGQPIAENIRHHQTPR